MHLVLSKADAAELTRKGWCEPHVLVGKHPGIASGLVLVYAPRDEGEVDICLQILECSLGYVRGV